MQDKRAPEISFHSRTQSPQAEKIHQQRVRHTLPVTILLTLTIPAVGIIIIIPIFQGRNLRIGEVQHLAKPPIQEEVDLKY